MQPWLFDPRPASKRRFASGKKVGRPPEEDSGQRHERRPNRNPRHPLHITTKVCPGLETLRTNEAFAIIIGTIGECQGRFGMLVTHFSIQSNHMHLIVEVDGTELQPSCRGLHVKDLKTPEELAKQALSKGLKGLFGKIAKRLNSRLWRRKGQVFAERYHAVAIESALQMKRTIEYVLHNGFKHGATTLPIDPYSSGPWFDGWEEPIELPAEPRESWPVAQPRTWLGREGWKRHGLIPFPVAA